MKAEKLIRVLAWLQFGGWSPHNIMVGVTGGCELKLEFNGQLDRTADRWLRSRGFVEVDGDYIYRPIVRRRRGA